MSLLLQPVHKCIDVLTAICGSGPGHEITVGGKLDVAQAHKLPLRQFPCNKRVIQRDPLAVNDRLYPDVGIGNDQGSPSVLRRQACCFEPV